MSAAASDEVKPSEEAPPQAPLEVLDHHSGLPMLVDEAVEDESMPSYMNVTNTSSSTKPDDSRIEGNKCTELELQTVETTEKATESERFKNKWDKLKKDLEKYQLDPQLKTIDFVQAEESSTVINDKRTLLSSITSSQSPSQQWTDSNCSPMVSLSIPDVGSILDSDDSSVLEASERKMLSKSAWVKRPLFQPVHTSSRKLQTVPSTTEDPASPEIRRNHGRQPQEPSGECNKVDAGGVIRKFGPLPMNNREIRMAEANGTSNIWKAKEIHDSTRHTEEEAVDSQELSSKTSSGALTTRDRIHSGDEQSLFVGETSCLVSAADNTKWPRLGRICGIVRHLFKSCCGVCCCPQTASFEVTRLQESDASSVPEIRVTPSPQQADQRSWDTK